MAQRTEFDSESDSDISEVCEVSKIVKSRNTRNGVLYLIRWKGYGPSDDTWEPEEHLVDCQDVLEEYKLKQSNLKVLHRKIPAPISPARRTKSVTKVQNKTSVSRNAKKKVSTLSTAVPHTTSENVLASKKTAGYTSTATVVIAAKSNSSRMSEQTEDWDVTPHIPPMSVLRRPPIKSFNNRSAEKTDILTARRVLDMPKNTTTSFFKRHERTFFLLFATLILSLTLFAINQKQIENIF
ncbi:uncharacterized protein LOC102807960 [Saccoglossus kowalevskii]|uniref:Chromodomain Y-like protein-like n=1 Tax=Saccoglossus kowalevskii TaxID=10224 RepID=A0ABM0M2Z9_SACKO|nr:PREDICTED: chromodomain Y-like protein-like [Saccoglossus kowalevskii]